MTTVPNMNKIKPFFSEISQQTHKMYEQVAIITQLWYRVKYYSTSIRNTWYLIIVPKLNKISTFFYDISHTQTTFMKECHSYSNLA